MATSQDFVNWVCGPDLDPRFLAYLFRASRTYLRSLSSGAIHQTIYMPTVEAFEVCIPDLKEQKRIVCSLDEQIATVERARVAAEAQFEAAKALAAACRRAIFTGIQASAWPTVRLGEVCEVVNGFGFAEHLQGRQGLPYPFVKVSDMNAEGAETEIKAAANTVDDALLRMLRARTYPAGTVIFPKVGGALLTNKKRILGVEGAFDNNIMGVVPTAVDGRWLFHWLQTVDLAAMANTQALPSIRQSEIAALEIPLPPAADQRRIVAELASELSEVDGARMSAKHQLAAISSLPAALLRRAFNGEL